MKYISSRFQTITFQTNQIADVFGCQRKCQIYLWKKPWQLGDILLLKNLTTFLKIITKTENSTIITDESSLVQSSIRLLSNRLFNACKKNCQFDACATFEEIVESTLMQSSNQRLCICPFNAFINFVSTLCTCIDFRFTYSVF